MFLVTFSRNEESMSAKLAFPSALILAVVSCCMAHAQAPPAAMNETEAAAPAPTPGNEALSPTDMTAPARPPLPPGLSKWITYGQPDCSGLIGGNGPIKEELYLRTGPSLPLGESLFGHVLTTGWDVQGGGRTLFFNPAMDRAWSVDLSISSIWNDGQHADRKFPLFLLASPNPPAVAGGTPDVYSATVLGTLRELNRTSVNLGLGREWYLIGKATSCACGERNWRVGIDGGAGYGTESASINIDSIPGLPPVDLTTPSNGSTVIHMMRRRTDTIASSFVSLHTDLEIPHGCCVYQVGFRVEWAYTWSDIMQRQNDSNIMEVNLLMTFGVRF